MNRMAMGALCVAVRLITLAQAKHMRKVVGIFVFEQLERIFDVVENVLHPA
jgi:hypothetical protein